MALTLLLAASLAAAVPGAGQDCRSALEGAFDDGSDGPLPGQIQGNEIGGRDALLALRAARGDAPILIAGGSFRGADFRGARLHNVCFLGTDLIGSDWRGALAPGIAFARADLTGARLEDARMPGILLREPTLKDADASRADFSGGVLNGGWEGSLENLRLDGADLSGFRFDCGITIDDGCPLERDISFRGANLTGAAIDSYWGSGGFEGARIDRTIVALPQLLDLADAEIAGPVIVRGGDSTLALGREDYRALLPHIEIAGEPEIDAPDAATRPPAWARPGTVALFVGGPVEFDDAFRSTTLYRRLLPVIVGAAWSRLVARVNPDGTIDARGDAIGGNAHLCSLAGNGLALDRAAGWYSGPQTPQENDPAEWRERPMRVLRFHGDRALVWKNGHAGGQHVDGDSRYSDYASCGARAGFSEMVRVPVGEAEARRIFDSYGDME